MALAPGTHPYLDVSPAKLERAREAATLIDERRCLSEGVEAYRDLIWEGAAAHEPSLILDDVSELPFLDGIAGVEEYQHRARPRATTGDLFAAVTPPAPGYERYCRERLGIGSPDAVLAEPLPSPIAVASACSRELAFREIARWADAKSVVIHPYMSIEPVWQLARRLKEETRRDVRVVGSPPPITWFANDKARFRELVDHVLGAHWNVETHTARAPEAMVEHLLALASRHRRIALKRTRCASGMGNQVFEAKSVKERAHSEIAFDVQAFLERTLWDGEQEVLVVSWEDTDLSPSAQLWIPPLGSGEPVLDGIYEQILEGEAKVFLGSRPSTLPAAINQRIGNASMLLATALQALGYVGRCSFDLIALGDPNEDCTLKFVECNGRWGGTSIPMHLVDRVVPGERPPYRAQDVARPELVGVSFTDVTTRLGDSLFDAHTGKGRFILYNVGPLTSFGKLDVISIGSTQDEAEQALQVELPERLRLQG